MFNPSQREVREFFCGTYQKSLNRLPLTALEVLAKDWIDLHPEYHSDLASVERAVELQYGPEQGQSNPFLHLAMHLSISEQISIDQPPGIQLAFHSLCKRLGDKHAAAHEVMECLGQMLWQAQRSNLPPDGIAYVECVQRRGGA
jgi:Domain of unknown function (DUF1841)